MSFMNSLRAERAQAAVVSPASTAYTQRLIREFQKANIATNVRDAVLNEIAVIFKHKGCVAGIDDVRWSHNLTEVLQASVPPADKATLDHYIRSEVERGWSMALDTIMQSYGRKEKKLLQTARPMIRCGYAEHESKKLDQSGDKPKYIPYIQPYVSASIWCGFPLTLK